ncbi:hypothetical protein [Aurantimonas coralicida]|uniref:hypothetical protein n=1 Tax=Aurantimonas coralicida TaxID=182270 RepID=UPI00238AB61B|nr:hypothetical protein [Aurantimonas coralicida]MDE0921797.1 hypothetical protein [Aurantimonas coralicida]
MSSELPPSTAAGYPSMTLKCLDMTQWRSAKPAEIKDFLDRIPDKPSGKKRKRSRKKLKVKKFPRPHLVVRYGLIPLDVYSYLKLRFGVPNGFQNFLRRDDSDNWIHWEYHLICADGDILISGMSREIHIAMPVPLKKRQWRELIMQFKEEFKNNGPEKSKVVKSLEKFVIFQNKFSNLADMCAELYHSIENFERTPYPFESLDGLDKISGRSTYDSNISELYGSCLKLRMLTPIMAEAFINMVILVFVNDEIRGNKTAYDEFVRAKIPDRLSRLSEDCFGFERPVDRSSPEYGAFMSVMNKRNFALHGNVDPVREAVEVVYFDGKRPLYTESGDHIKKLLEQIENLHAPQVVLSDYRATHLFLFRILECMRAPVREWFYHVINDPFPGFEVKKKRVTKVLPEFNMIAHFQGIVYDDAIYSE